MQELGSYGEPKLPDVIAQRPARADLLSSRDINHHTTRVSALTLLPDEALSYVGRRLGIRPSPGESLAHCIERSGASVIDLVLALLPAEAQWFPEACGLLCGVHVHYGPPPLYPQRRSPLPRMRDEERRVLALLPSCPLTTPTAMARWSLLRPGIREGSFVARGGRLRDLREWSSQRWIVLGERGEVPTQEQMLSAASALRQRVDGRVLRWQRAREETTQCSTS